MKKLFAPFFGMFLLSAMDINSIARAADWTIPANPGCEVGLGNVTNTGPGFTASGGSAVIGCSLTKIVGNGNLNWVYARINRNLPGGADPLCNLDSYDSDGGRVCELFPDCPAGTERVVAKHACFRYSGRVGRSAAAKALNEKAVRVGCHRTCPPRQDFLRQAARRRL